MTSQISTDFKIRLKIELVVGRWWRSARTQEVFPTKKTQKFTPAPLVPTEAVGVGGVQTRTVLF
jgi:hypothetical protein